MGDFGLAEALRSDRWIVITALIIVSMAGLAYTAWLALGSDMSGMMSPDYVPWSPGYFIYMLVMWMAMMVGMMTPSVAPTVMLYAALARQHVPRLAFAPPGWFFAGYLLAWAAFSLFATLLQWLLEWRALVTPMMAGTSQLLGGVALIGAGIYQWLPAKHACLASCRAPLAFVQRHGGFRPGVFASLRLGWLHGLYCVGCCWALMALLFAFGVMNLTWIAGLMILVLAEKLAPAARFLARGSGAVAIVAGAVMVFRALQA